MHTTPTPYIGIAGVTDPAHSRALAQLSRPGRPIMLGALVSPATIAGKPSCWFPARYPRVETIPSIFQDDDGVLNAVHLGGCGRGDLTGHLLAAEAICHFDALQLNCAWPDPAAIEDWKSSPRVGRALPPLFILQVPAKAIADVDGEPESVVARIARYAHVADHVLIDPSGGQGVSLDTAWASRLATAFRENLDLANVGLGFAGGLRPANVYPDAGILARDCGPNVSIDAESGLRDDGDLFLVDAAIAYVQDAYRAFGMPAQGPRATR